MHESFVGLYLVDAIDAGTLFDVIKDVLARLNISFNKIRGQCYDGASSMSGAKSGVAKKLLDNEPRAGFTHCYGHALNLAGNDSIKQCKDVLDTTYEICKLVKKSPRRDCVFEKLKQELASDSPGLRVLCPTRWTVRADAFKSIMDNYKKHG